MRGYSAIVGVFRQKCGFLPDRAYPRFKPAIVLRCRLDSGRLSRIVLLKQVAPALVFSDIYESCKGRQLEANPRAAGTLYWREDPAADQCRGAGGEVGRGVARTLGP